MDSQALLAVLDKYQNREIDLIEVSFQLTCIMGCNSDEAIVLLEHYKPTEDAVG